MYVCICNRVSDNRIRNAVAAGVNSFEALQDTLNVSTCCGCCEPEVRETLQECLGDAPERPATVDDQPLHYRAA